MVCTDEASLLYMRLTGLYRNDPWSSRVQSPDHPDWCIIDLDPDKNKFDEVVEAAQVTRRYWKRPVSFPIANFRIKPVCIFIFRLERNMNYEASKNLPRTDCNDVNKEMPEFHSIARATKDRKGKIYLDFLQNRPQRLCHAYSIRPKPGATVPCLCTGGSEKRIDYPGFQY